MAITSRGKKTSLRDRLLPKKIFFSNRAQCLPFCLLSRKKPEKKKTEIREPEGGGYETQGEDATSCYIAVGSVTDSQSIVYLLCTGPDQTPVVIARVKVFWLDDQRRILDPPTTEFGYVAPEASLPSALAPYASALVWFLSLLGTNPQRVPGNKSMPLVPVLAAEYTGALRTYALLKAQGSPPAIPGDIIKAIEQPIGGQYRLFAPEFRTAIAAAGFIDESTLVGAIRLSLAERAARVARGAVSQERLQRLPTGHLGLLTRTAANVVSRLPSYTQGGARNLLPEEINEYIGRIQARDAYDTWTSTCSAAPDIGSGVLPNASALLGMAPALGVNPTAQQQRDPTLLCSDLAWPVMTAGLDAAYGVPPSRAPPPATSEQREGLEDALRSNHLSHSLSSIVLNAWRNVCKVGPDAVVTPNIVLHTAEILQETGIPTADAHRLAAMSGALIASGATPVVSGPVRFDQTVPALVSEYEDTETIAETEFVDDAYVPLLMTAHFLGIPLSDEDLLHPGRLCSLLASILFDPSLAPQQQTVLPLLA